MIFICFYVTQNHQMIVFVFMKLSTEKLKKVLKVFLRKTFFLYRKISFHLKRKIRKFCLVTVRYSQC